MRKTLFLKTICIILCLTAIIFINLPIAYASETNPTGILGEDTDSNGYRALTFTVNPVSTTSSLQGFAVGWHVKIKDKEGNDFAEVYLPTPPQFNGKSRKYYLPLSKEYRHTAVTGEIVSSSIESQIGSTKAGEYQDIVRNPAGTTFFVDARIQKYTYDPSRTQKYISVNPAVYANNMDEINDNFGEFSPAFKNNLPGNYFGLNKHFPPEPPKIIPDPKVTLNLPQDKSTVVQGTTVTFQGTGENCHHISGFVDNEFLSQQNNPSSSISTKMTYKTTVKLDELGPHTFYILGRVDDGDGKTDKSLTHTVYVVPPSPTSGKIEVRCFNYDTGTEIDNTAQTLYADIGKPQIVKSPLTDKTLNFKGSYQTFSTDPFDKTKMQDGVDSQTVTLSVKNKIAYVYFVYKDVPPAPVKPPVPFNYDPIAIINNPAVAYAGDDVLIDGSSSYDEDGSIEHYYWEVPGTDGSDPYNLWSNSMGDNQNGTVWYPNVGTFDINLQVVDDGGCSGYDKSIIEVIEPKPSIDINVTANKMKENRKITLDLSKSKSATRFPIDWSLTTWTIQPIYGTGATDDYGVRLENDTVIKNINNIAYQYQGGAWQNTGLAFNFVLTGQKTIQFQARDSGQYKITVSMTNTSMFNSAVHYSNTLDRTITIVEDLAPVASFDGPESFLRDKENPIDPTLQKYGICEVSCTSKSPDGDPLGKRIWAMRFDSDNDIDTGKSKAEAFGDEITVHPYTGTDIFSDGIRLIVSSDRDSTAEIWTYPVGYFTCLLTVFEDIPDNETVKELLVESDYKSGYIQGW